MSEPPPLPSTPPRGAKPPPVPVAVSTAGAETATYSTRNDAFTPACELRVTGGVLTIGTPDKPARTIPLNTVQELRLEFAPTRVEPNRYRCRLRQRGGSGLTFFNRSYEDVAQFRETSADYVAFVQTMVTAIGHHAPDCRLVSGSGAAVYALSVVGFRVAVAVVIGVAIFALLGGLWWLVIVKAAIIVFYLPNCWRWLRRNREAEFASQTIPSAVLPD